LFCRWRSKIYITLRSGEPSKIQIVGFILEDILRDEAPLRRLQHRHDHVGYKTKKPAIVDTLDVNTADLVRVGVEIKRYPSSSVSAAHKQGGRGHWTGGALTGVLSFAAFRQKSLLESGSGGGGEGRANF